MSAALAALKALQVLKAVETLAKAKQIATAAKLAQATKLTKPAQAVKAIAVSKSAQTAAKIAIVGGGVAGAGALIGTGIQQAIVKPLQDLGLVEKREDGPATKGQGIIENVKQASKLTNTGKVVIIGAIGIIAIAVIAKAFGGKRR